MKGPNDARYTQCLKLPILAIALAVEILVAPSARSQFKWTNDDAPVAIRALNDKNVAVRREAIEALRRMGPFNQKQVPIHALTEALRDQDIEVRRVAADLLGMMRSPDEKSVVPALCATLKDPDVILKRRAVSALQGFGSKDARVCLLFALRDPDPAVQIQAARALVSHPTVFSIPLTRNGDSQSVFAATPDTIAAFLALRALLKNSKPIFRIEVAEALGDMWPWAKTAMSGLVDALKDSDPAVRRHAARAFEGVEPWLKIEVPGLKQALRDSAVPALRSALKDSDAKIRHDAISALGVIGPDAESAVPALIDALRDPDVFVRRNVADALSKIGPVAKAAVPALLDAELNDPDSEVQFMAGRALTSIHTESLFPFISALQSPDPKVRLSAVNALAMMRGEAKLAVPALGTALKDPDAKVRRAAATSLGNMDLNEESSTPALVDALLDALKDSDKSVRQLTEQALATIRPQSEAAALALAAALKDTDPIVQENAARTLGLFGPWAKPAIPALIAALRGSCAGACSLPRGDADALSEIASASLNSRRSDMIQPLTQVAEALDHAKFPDQSRNVRMALDVLQAIHRGEVVGIFLERIGKHRSVVMLALAYIFMVLFCLVILLISPLSLWRINEIPVLSKTVKLPGWLGGVEFSLAHVFVVGFFHYHPWLLDAWVSKHIVTAQDQFRRMTTVREREVHVAVPVELDGSVVPGLKPGDLNSIFERKQVCIVICGEGGAGKTSLACQIAHWGMSDEAVMRPCAHRMLPVMIEQDLNLEVGKDKVVLMEVIRGQLKNLTSEDEPPKQEFVRHLLKRKRALVIVDGLSELNESTRNKIRPLDPEFSANALIVTSRLEETLDGVTKSTLHPMRIQGNRLSSFMEAYLVKRGKRDLFDDAEFFNGCSKLSVMVGDRDTTVLLAKLYAEQMIGSKGRPEENLPENVPDLMLQYLNKLNRKEGGLEDRAVHSAAKTIAWECLRQTYRPAPARVENVLEALGGGHASEECIKYLEQKLHLVQVIGVAHDRVKFALDPLAEYLAGLYLVEHYLDNEQLWGDFLTQADTVPGAPEAVKGFLLAVRDCCLARAGELHAPAFVSDELAKRVGLDADFGDRIRIKQRLARFMAHLDSPDANDRAMALNVLSTLGEDAVPAVPALIRALKDENRNVRAEAADALGSIGQAAGEAIPALMECLTGSDKVLCYYSAIALAHVGCTDEAVVSGLMELLRGGLGPREEALRALADLGPQARAAVPALTAVLSDKLEEYVLLAVEALAAIGSGAPGAVPSLEGLAASHASEKVRSAAVDALKAIRTQQV